jgi:O-antigen ligase
MAKGFLGQGKFFFLAVCMASSALSAMPAYAFSEGLAWFRFPLFAMATVFWLGTDKRLLYAMIVSTALGLLLMNGILLTEVILEGHKFGRLTWPFDDTVSGNYLAKFGLPSFVVIAALALGGKPRLGLIMAVLSLITFCVTVLTGERINALVMLCAGILATLAWKPIWRRYVSMTIVSTSIVLSVVMTTPNLLNRFSETIDDVLPLSQSAYYQVINAGLKVYESAPILGIGPATHRELCGSIVNTMKEVLCSNHPHNYYIQLLAETGTVGLITGSVMILSISWAAFAGWRKNRANVVAATAFVVPFGLFFPIQSTADFFGQWSNIFMWSAIALSLAAARTLVLSKY